MSIDYYVLAYAPDKDYVTQQSILESILRYNSIFESSSIKWITSEELYNPQVVQVISGDIQSINPKVIIISGINIYNLLVDNPKGIGELSSSRVGNKQYPTILTHTLDYMIKETDPAIATQLKREFISHIITATKVVSGEICDITSKELVTALTYQQFKEYVDIHIINADKVAYDIETNAQLVYSVWFRTIGFSLSGDSSSGVYVVREALEYKVSEDEWSSITSLLLSILKSKHIIVHNSMYEVPAGVNEYDYRLENFDDTLVMARLLLGGKVGAGLKEQCQVNLGYPEWEADLTVYRESMDTLRNLFRPTAKGTSRQEFTDLEEVNGDLLLLHDKYESEYDEYSNWLFNDSLTPDDKGKSLTLNERADLIDKLPKRRDYQLVQSINQIVSLINQYYKNDIDHTPEYIITLVGKELINLVNSSEFGFLPYSSIPLKLLSKYGAIDAVGTRELYDKLSDRLTNESTSEVDLWKGYNIMKSQFEVGTSMEMNGLYWNDEVAAQEQIWFNQQACKAMRALLLSGYLDEFIFNSGKEDWVRYLIDNSPEELSEQLGYEFLLVEDGRGIKKFEDGELKGREIRIYNIPNLINESYWDSVHDIVVRMMKLKIADESNFKDFDEFKYIYNPASPGQHKVLNPILVSDDIKIANVLHGFNLIIEDASKSIDDYPDPDREVLQTLINFNMYNKDTKDWNEEHPEDKRELISQKDIFQRFKSMMSTTTFKSKELNNLIVCGLKYQLESGDEPSIIELYHLYVLIGVNVEDELTWDESFRFLYNYRMYKKCIKMINSYITGDKVGRGSVAVVNKSELANTLARRIGWYNDGPITEDKAYLMQASYAVCGANTLRWRTGQHTIPSTSSIKNIYTSRYLGGVIFAPDYSQMEIRTIAAVSGCQTLVQAFIDGMDIHRFNASRIWRKPPEEVTSVERRYAKMSCGVGSTKVKLLDDTVRTLEELYNSGIEGLYTYSYDITNQKVVPGKIVDVDLTKYVTQTCKVTFDNGFSEERTLDHPYLCIDGRYIEAEDLQEGQQIETLYTRVPISGAYSMQYDQRRGTEYCYSYKVGKFGHIYRAQKVLRYLKSIGLELTEDNYNAYRYIAGSRVIYWSTLVRNYNLTFEDVLNYPSYYNSELDNEEIYKNPLSGRSYAKVQGVRVVSVEIINHEQPVPVYDISVAKYHNYASYLGNNTSVFVHNSFSILYGDTPEGFAHKFLSGDESLGRQIFRDFYAAYPEILEWTNKRHEEMRTTGKVSLAKTGMFLHISPNEFYGDEGKAARAAGNYPIQSQASNMAGYILYRADKFLRDNHMKTKPILFIHDSLEFDVHPFEMLVAAQHIITMMNEIPHNEFGIPAKVDLELGVSLGQGLEASNIIINEDGNSGEMIIEGKLANFELLIDKWKSIYSSVEIEELEEPEEVYVPRGDLFVPKLTISRSFGTYEKSVKCKVSVVY